MKVMKISVCLELESFVTLSEDEFWPDGVPETVTEDTVLAELRKDVGVTPEAPLTGHRLRQLIDQIPALEDAMTFSVRVYKVLEPEDLTDGFLRKLSEDLSADISRGRAEGLLKTPMNEETLKEQLKRGKDE